MGYCSSTCWVIVGCQPSLPLSLLSRPCPLQRFVRASTLLVPFKLGGGFSWPLEKRKKFTEKVKQIISEQLGVEESEVTPSASFVDDLGADSLDQVELVMALEEALRPGDSGRGSGENRTVQDAIDYVEKHAKVRQ